MLASWMLYAALISILLSLAGVAVERALSTRGRPTRFVWVATLALSLAWPLAPTIARMIPSAPRPVQLLPFTIVVQAPGTVSPDEAAAVRRAQIIDRSLAGLWITLTLLLCARLAIGVASLERSRATWKRGRVNGVRVQLSNNVGPAVVGLRSMDVVLPEWILSLDESLRALVLRHEEEHRMAGDPYLLFGAAIAVALMPWNPALWFQARRLRLAIEMDCDARVLRAHPTPERYGMLILTIAQRRSIAPTLFAPMLSEPTTNLERRILAMRTTSRRLARTTMYGGGVVAVALLAFASSLQSAGTSFKRPNVVDAVARAVSMAAPAVRPETIPVPKASDAKPAGIPRNEMIAPPGIPGLRKLEPVEITGVREQGTNPVPRYPAMLLSAGVEGATLVRFNTDANGQAIPSSALILMSTHDLFSEAVRASLQTWRGQPNTTVQIPYVFLMADQTAKDIKGNEKSLPPGAVVIVGTRPANGGPIEALKNNVIARGVVGGTPTPMSAEQTFFDFQVEQQVTPAPGNVAPRYPDVLRSANVEGVVLAQFVVETDGSADTATFKVLRSTHDLFTNAVKQSLASMRFNPALVGGKPVKQLVQMPFQFSLAKEP
jgi:TonB family protein